MMEILTQFGLDVERGLKSDPKAISSRYFYNERGDELFQQIMELPEYYLTKSELEIFKEQTPAIIDALDIKDSYELIELGAGDGTKTIYLLKEILKRDCDFEYCPIDISSHAINILKNKLNLQLPDVKYKGRVGEYFEVLGSLNSHRPKGVLFLGSNIGNLKDDIAKTFIKELSNQLNIGDKLLIGFDLKKSKDIILPAYNDSKGVTSAFNLNLLARMNKELFANFDLDNWEHVPNYDEDTGLASSTLKSKTDQKVFIGALDEYFEFKAGEMIHTEISRKYDDQIINDLVKDSGLEVTASFTDSKEYFKDVVFTKTD